MLFRCYLHWRIRKHRHCTKRAWRARTWEPEAGQQLAQGLIEGQTIKPLAVHIGVHSVHLHLLVAPQEVAHLQGWVVDLWQ